MSRIGKKPIPLPQGVKINIGNDIAGGGSQGQTGSADPAGRSD